MLRSARRFSAFFIAMLILLSFLPIKASAEDYTFSKVLLQTYPNSTWTTSYTPIVMDNVSDFIVATTTSGVLITGVSFSPATETFENQDYTITVTLQTQAVNCTFTADTLCYMNNVQCTLVPSADGQTATVTRVLTPKVVGPTVYHDPTDEKHNAGETFSFTSTADRYATDYQWYVKDLTGKSYLAENISSVVSGVTATITDMDNGSRCNLSNVPFVMDGWQVYCAFSNPYGTTNSRSASIIIANAEDFIVVLEESPSPSPVETAATPKPGITVVETPEPTSEIKIIEEDWEDTWTYDEVSHWHASKIPQDASVNDLAPHEMVWEEVTPAAKKASGEEHGICSVCGYETTRETEYDPSSASSIFGSMDTPTILKYVAIGIGIAIILIAIYLVIQSVTANQRRKKRRAQRMAQRRNSNRY